MNALTQQQVLDHLKSPDLVKRIEAIRLVPNLASHQALAIIEGVLVSCESLAMKVEALGVLPDVVTVRFWEEATRILQIALRNSDAEVIRSALTAIQRMPSCYPTKLFINAILNLLEAHDTDLQYQAIRTLSHVRSQMAHEPLRSRIQPLLRHRNEVLRQALSI